MTIPPMIRPEVAWGHPGMAAPLDPLRAHTRPPGPGVDALEDLDVPVTLDVTDGRAADGVATRGWSCHTMLQWESEPNSVLVSEAPG